MVVLPPLTVASFIQPAGWPKLCWDGWSTLFMHSPILKGLDQIYSQHDDLKASGGWELKVQSLLRPKLRRHTSQFCHILLDQSSHKAKERGNRLYLSIRGHSITLQRNMFTELGEVIGAIFADNLVFMGSHDWNVQNPGRWDPGAQALSEFIYIYNLFERASTSR